ncbi:hypothetical protein JR316_0008610 [Psilocybe cubensis]|uniref:Uncharacterized protein n=2 Tax=Psilocybe cubensis TaxID=181762 RepID=A0ACB8GRW3_PSICU|nr:hypothetical protein JR316_0008610 [Psilocybe cubensis]KAH9478157.1 hypothetical protein JR316_0008610 [Psilocybe cubensis]
MQRPEKRKRESEETGYKKKTREDNHKNIASKKDDDATDQFTNEEVQNQNDAEPDSDDPYYPWDYEEWYKDYYDAPSPDQQIIRTITDEQNNSPNTQTPEHYVLWNPFEKNPSFAPPGNGDILLKTYLEEFEKQGRNTPKNNPFHHLGYIPRFTRGKGKELPPCLQRQAWRK